MLLLLLFNFITIIFQWLSKSVVEDMGGNQVHYSAVCSKILCKKRIHTLTYQMHKTAWKVREEKKMQLLNMRWTISDLSTVLLIPIEVLLTRRKPGNLAVWFWNNSKSRGIHGQTVKTPKCPFCFSKIISLILLHMLC